VRKRLRRRYLILEFRGGRGKETLLERLGSSLDRPSLKLIPLGPHLMLVRCSHLQVEELKKSLELIRREEEVRILGVSGTVKGARRVLEKQGISPGF
jgi:RNase P/RNase MRP subunit POP5